jgi:hypothetical protein
MPAINRTEATNRSVVEQLCRLPSDRSDPEVRGVHDAPIGGRRAGGLTTIGELGIGSLKAPADYPAQSMEGRRRVRGGPTRAPEIRAQSRPLRPVQKTGNTALAGTSRA